MISILTVMIFIVKIMLLFILLIWGWWFAVDFHGLKAIEAACGVGDWLARDELEKRVDARVSAEEGGQWVRDFAPSIIIRREHAVAGEA